MAKTLSRPPIGYHLTFHPYGTWLPGDPRGWTHHGDRGETQRPPSPPLAGICAERLRAPTLFFGPRHCEVVEGSIRETCRIRGWMLHALAVDFDHVHVVVTADVAPDSLLHLLKRWATHHLREARILAPDRPVWARHGSTRGLFSRRRFENARAYVLRHRQGTTPPIGAPDGDPGAGRSHP